MKGEPVTSGFVSAKLKTFGGIGNSFQMVNGSLTFCFDPTHRSLAFNLGKIEYNKIDLKMIGLFFKFMH